jgi:hypothetical protein
MKAEPRRTKHEKYTANNVLLGRLETSEGVYLLQKIEMSDLLYQPDPVFWRKLNGSGNLKRRHWLDGVKVQRTNANYAIRLARLPFYYLLL